MSPPPESTALITGAGAPPAQVYIDQRLKAGLNLLLFLYVLSLYCLTVYI